MLLGQALAAGPALAAGAVIAAAGGGFGADHGRQCGIEGNSADIDENEGARNDTGFGSRASGTKGENHNEA